MVVIYTTKKTEEERSKSYLKKQTRSIFFFKSNKKISSKSTAHTVELEKGEKIPISKTATNKNIYLEKNKE